MKLNIVLVLVVHLGHIFPVSSARKVDKIIPESPFIAIEGERKQLHCILEASESPVPMSYGNVIVLRNPPSTEVLTTGKNITVSKVKRGLQAITTVEFHPLSLSDVGTSGFFCTDKTFATGTHANSFILPKGGVPKIKFTSTIPTVYGSEAVFSCKASITGANVDLYLNWLHYKWSNASVGEVVTAKEKPKQGGTSPEKTIENVLKVVLSEKTAGTYECVISARVKKSVDFNYTRNATLKAPLKLVDGVQSKQTLKVYQKKYAVMVCQAVSSPPPTVAWKKGNNPIQASSDSRYRFSNYGSTKWGTFVIKGVSLKDRGIYTCNASTGISFVSMEFTLHVEGPRGTRWTLIGIIIGVGLFILLLISGLGYLYWKKKKREPHDIPVERNQEDAIFIKPL